MNKSLKGTHLSAAGENRVFKSMLGHMAFFCQECWRQVEALVLREDVNTHVPWYRALDTAPTGHTWFHQSLSVFKECAGPPERGIGRENLKMALQCRDSRSQIRKKVFLRNSETKDSC